MLRGARLALLLASMCVAMFAVSREAGAIAQASIEDATLEMAEREVVIVNGSLSATGAARDALRLRGRVINWDIPYPESFSAEQMLSRHSILLDDPSGCDRALCLVSESTEAQLLALPDADYLMGLGFTSRTTQRPAVNLVAVVDRSASMRGVPLELTKRSLAELVRHLSPQDQLSIVVYGNMVRTYAAPTQVTPANRKKLLAAIERIRTDDGAVTLESGLAFGYRMARAIGSDFDGASRVLLFTDQHPDEADESANSFMAQALRGSQAGVGLTTVGVTMPFKPRLAAAIGSVHGANLALVSSDADVAQLFGTALNALVSELAHDVRISITPARGYSIAGVYGLPGALLMHSPDTTLESKLEIIVPTAFMNSRASRIFVSLARQPGNAGPRAFGEPLAHIAMVYAPANGARVESDSLLAVPAPEPSPAMALAQLLIDEFTTLRRASMTYHVEQDQDSAFAQVHAFATRLRASKVPGLTAERRLVNSLEERLAFLTGHADDTELVRSRISRLWGVWRVRSVQGRTDFRANERIEFTPDSKFRFFEKEAGRHVVTSVANISASRQQIQMDYSGVVYNYEVRGSELVLEERPGTLVFLQRSSLD